uniref:Bm12710 n=1 Tax=Brugia malayi TaxID=6279 RepID=A0A1I9GBW0_BRUMA|nr:Bm12710 [Brugia malayi]
MEPNVCQKGIGLQPRGLEPQKCLLLTIVWPGEAGPPLPLLCSYTGSLVRAEQKLQGPKILGSSSHQSLAPHC